VQRIFVGDIQGCADELDELLTRATREFGKRFELWPVGDLVNRGPANLRVLERIHDLWSQGRAFPVLGNHEIALLRTALGLRRLTRLDTLDEVLESKDASEWVDWLRLLPLARTGKIAGTAFLMVHAAALPGSIEDTVADARRAEKRLHTPKPKQLRRFLAEDPSDRKAHPHANALARLVSCRSVDPSDPAGHWSEAEPGGGSEPWHVAWRRARPDYGVIYGHWSLQGLHVAKGLRGLDTGCVHHGRTGDGHLTAWLPGARKHPFATPDTRLWQFKGHRRYL
jgi:bis(5'-nucleosyl)-tetraphosphatase (symmetrical)